MRHMAEAGLPGCLEDVNGPNHVDLRPKDWVRPTEGHLQRREVDDVRGRVLTKGHQNVRRAR